MDAHGLALSVVFHTDADEGSLLRLTSHLIKGPGSRGSWRKHGRAAGRGT